MSLSERARRYPLVLISGAALAVEACGSATGGNASEQAAHSLGSGAYLKVWTDPDTGCRYYIYREGFAQYAVGGMSPRLNSGGTPDCSASVGRNPKGGDVQQAPSRSDEHAVTPKAADAHPQPDNKHG